jgi:hypothetical protein
MLGCHSRKNYPAARPMVIQQQHVEAPTRLRGMSSPDRSTERIEEFVDPSRTDGDLALVGSRTSTVALDLNNVIQ